MDLSDLKNAIAGYHEKTTSDFVVNGVDLLLQAINNAKRWAQSNYDFEMCRRSVQLTVNTSTGGLLSLAQPVGGGSVVAVKKIEAAFLGYSNAQRPIEFVGKSTMSNDLRRRYNDLYYAENQSSPLSQDSPIRATRGTLPTLVQQGDTLFLYPDSTNIFASGSTTVYLDVIEKLPDYADDGVTVTGTLNPDATEGSPYTRMGSWNSLPMYMNTVDAQYFLLYSTTVNRWLLVSSASSGVFGNPTNYWQGSATATAAAAAGAYTAAGTFTGTATVALSTPSASDFFLTYGYEFLFWRSIVEGNYLFKSFVPREEGNLSAPERPLAEAWKALLAWDNGIVSTNTTAFDLD